MNYWGLGVFVVLMILLVIWLIRRNMKDEKDFEKEIIQSEIKPEEGKENNDELL